MNDSDQALPGPPGSPRSIDISPASELLFDTHSEPVPQAPVPDLVLLQSDAEPTEPRESLWMRMGREFMTGLQTLVSAAVYATLIVTFGVQVARVDGLSMAPTLEHPALGSCTEEIHRGQSEGPLVAHPGRPHFLITKS